MDKKIIDFIQKHHVLGCSFFYKEIIHSASCFYIFLNHPPRFIIASNKDTLHIRLAQKNSKVSGVIHLETKQIGKIQGVQYNGILTKANTQEKQAYLKRYPYAIALKPQLWHIDIENIKFTDNTLGFGKKLEFKKS
ncbi:MAG: hypothetical protein L3J44_04385 [Campylobacteraceae bacterium]|nr:hypothetical protein [Campylobacteraceae bacterium]